jgi:hypothetical protein
MTHEARFGPFIYHAEVFITKQGNNYSLIIDPKEQSEPLGVADPEIAASVKQALDEIVKKLNSR